MMTKKTARKSTLKPTDISLPTEQTAANDPRRFTLEQMEIQKQNPTLTHHITVLGTSL
jgi:hypothetical protein